MLFNEPSPLETKVLTRRFHLPNSASLETYLASEGYQAFMKASKMTHEQIIEEEAERAMAAWPEGAGAAVVVGAGGAVVVGAGPDGGAVVAVGFWAWPDEVVAVVRRVVVVAGGRAVVAHTADETCDPGFECPNFGLFVTDVLAAPVADRGASCGQLSGNLTVPPLTVVIV